MKTAVSESLFNKVGGLRLNVCLDFLVMYRNESIRNIRLISKFIKSQPSKQLQYTYCPIYHEVNAIRH